MPKPVGPQPVLHPKAAFGRDVEDSCTPSRPLNPRRAARAGERHRKSDKRLSATWLAVENAKGVFREHSVDEILKLGQRFDFFDGEEALHGISFQVQVGPAGVFVRVDREGSARVSSVALEIVSTR